MTIVFPQVTFLEDGDQEVFEKQMQAALHIQIACHELLGHGSGKIFKKKDDGTYNYKHGEVNQPVETLHTLYNSYLVS